MNYRFDEFAPQAIDYADPRVLADYDRKQQTQLDQQRELAERLNIGHGDRVVEFGPGTGALCIAMAQRGAEVHAVDPSEPMLGRLEASAGKHGLLDRIKIHPGGFLFYEHRLGQVDLVVTQFTLHHLPDFWKAIAAGRIHDMLAPGGRFYLRDVIFSFDPTDHVAALDRWIDPLVARGFWSRDEFESHVNREYSTMAWIMEGILERAGMTIIQSRYWQEACGEILSRKGNDTRRH
jgi:putative AdoMet-dependent methyltransferase